MTQLYLSWVCTQRTVYPATEIVTHPCLWWHYSQQQGDGTSTDGHSAEEWVIKMWYMHTTAFYSAVKRNEICRKVGEAGKYCIKGSDPNKNMCFLSCVDTCLCVCM